MRNFFYRISSALARFMYGRNGSDQLNLALLAGYMVLLLLQVFLNRFSAARMILDILTLLLAVVILYRIFSRKLDKRRAENAKFLNWWYPVRNRVSICRQRSKDKEHRYFVCKNCKTVCRVPAGKGKVEITCPKCGGKIIGKS